MKIININVFHTDYKEELTLFPKLINQLKKIKKKQNTLFFNHYNHCKIK